MSIIIPIVIAFDNHYAMPAGVSLYSMLACAKTEHPQSQNDSEKLFYKIHCLVDNLSLENQSKLKETLAPFSAFSSLEFLDISTPNLHATPIEPSAIDKINEAFCNSIFTLRLAFLKWSCAACFWLLYSHNTTKSSCLMQTLCF